MRTVPTTVGEQGKPCAACEARLAGVWLFYPSRQRSHTRNPL